MIHNNTSDYDTCDVRTLNEEIKIIVKQMNVTRND